MVEKFYVWKDGDRMENEFDEYLDALQCALDNDVDEIEKTIWNSEDAYSNGEPADNFCTAWSRY